MKSVKIILKFVPLVCAILVLIPASAADKISAEQIMAEVDYANRGAFKTQLAQVKFTTCRYRVVEGSVNCVEQPRIVVAASVKKNDINKEQVTDRQMSIVHEPARDRGTALLVFEYENKGRDNDNWIYLPALNKVNRVIANDDESGSVFGTEFSVETTENPEGRKLYEYTYRILEESTLRGRSVWVMEIKPKPYKAKKTDYEKIVSWIDKKTFLPLKENLHRDGMIYKRRTQKRIEKSDGIFVAKKVIMNNLKTKRITQMDKAAVRHNIDVPTEFLTHRGLTDFSFRERHLSRFQSEINKALVD